MKRFVLWLAGIGLLALWSALLFIGGWMSGQSRVMHEVGSPDGSWVARVRAHPALDPPAQSLWLGPRGGSLSRLARLAEDQEWCDEVVWSDDGRRVGFLVSGARLDVYAVPGGRFLGSTTLLPATADPGLREARRVAFSPDGHSVRFTNCVRGRANCLGENELRLEASE